MMVSTCELVVWVSDFPVKIGGYENFMQEKHKRKKDQNSECWAQFGCRTKKNQWSYKYSNVGMVQQGGGNEWDISGNLINMWYGNISICDRNLKRKDRWVSEIGRRRNWLVDCRDGKPVDSLTPRTPASSGLLNDVQFCLSLTIWPSHFFVPTHLWQDHNRLSKNEVDCGRRPPFSQKYFPWLVVCPLGRILFPSRGLWSERLSSLAAHPSCFRWSCSRSNLLFREVFNAFLAVFMSTVL